MPVRYAADDFWAGQCATSDHRVSRDFALEAAAAAAAAAEGAISRGVMAPH
jgi:hypothetical protein